MKSRKYTKWPNRSYTAEKFGTQRIAAESFLAGQPHSFIDPYATSSDGEKVNK